MMKKKFYLLAVATALVGTGAVAHHYSQPDVELTPTMIENIEALADGENGDYKCLHWIVKYTSVQSLSYTCTDGGTTVCPIMWPN